MVDVTEKEVTSREARAEATVEIAPETMGRILDKTMPKGNVLEAARLAGIMAAKKTWEMIPLCHSLLLTGIEVDFDTHVEKSEIRIRSRVRTTDRTGVEMEALMAVSNAALTIYDMCKAIDRQMRIGNIHLTFKTGGRSGTFQKS